MIVLVSCCEGFFKLNRHNSVEDARKQMKDEYLTMLKECGCDPNEDNSRFGIVDNSAWFDYYGGRCDWSIEEL